MVGRSHEGHAEEESEPLMNHEERYRDITSSSSNNTSDIDNDNNNDNHPSTPAERRRQSSNNPSSSTNSKKKQQPSTTVTALTPTASDGEASSHIDPSQHPDAPLQAVTVTDTSDRGLGSHLQVEEDSDPPTPRFYQDESSWKRWRWIPYPVRRMSKAVRKWSHGPPNPRTYKIKPLFPVVQEYPLVLVDRYLPKRKWRLWLVFIYCSLWLITFVLVKRQSTLATDIAGWGEPQSINCGVSYWGKNNDCGIEGNDCRPFSSSGFAFRCSAGCTSYHTLNPRAVGTQEINYDTFVIGGPSNELDGNATYRGDSYLCQAAIHAGVTTDQKGGCGVVYLVGQQANFQSSKSHGIASIGFDSYFPLSFQFVPDIRCEAADMRWDLLAVSAVYSGILSLFTANAALFFFANFVCIFWTVGMALDPPSYSNVTALFSDILGKFLPAMFVAWVMYDKMGVRRTLEGLTAQIEKAILWLGPCWIGALTNYTLDFIPIQRLNSHDLNQQPGAKAALSVIIILLVVIVVSQVWFFRQEARFIPYIKLYAVFVGGIVIALLLPGLNLRIHHYILALLLLPGTSMQTRPSLIYQGLLIGFFINGIARWNFDSILQTPDALRGDAQLGTGIPTIHTPTISLANDSSTAARPPPLSNITFQWDMPKNRSEFDGISVLVNDVERFRTYFEDERTPQQKFTWSRNASLDLPEYFRFGFMQGSDSADYTQAGTWTAEGEWVKMKPGPSKRGMNEKGQLLRRR